MLPVETFPSLSSKSCKLIENVCKYLGDIIIINTGRGPLLQVFGFFTMPLISNLLPPNELDRQPTVEEEFTLPLLSLEESAATNILRAKDSLSMLIERPVFAIHTYWRKFDDTYMRPVFGGPRREYR